MKRLEGDDTTRVLVDLGRGDPSAADRLLPLVYEELRALAHSYFRHQPAGHTLQPTALVHEAYLRLVGRTNPRFEGRAHFMATAATAMRHILVDRARRQAAMRQGGEINRITLDHDIAAGDQPDVDLLALDEALEALAELDARKSRVVELRFFGGLSIEQTAEALNVARSTVTEDWRMARAWVLNRLRQEGDAA